MALAPYVVLDQVTVPGGTPAPDPSGGGCIQPGSWAQLGPSTFTAGQVVWADSSAGSTPAQLLYQALQSAGASLVAMGTIDGTDTGVSN